jgi:hypothetical protein
MGEIDEIHQRILDTIQEDGARVGIALYKRYSQLYESLPKDQAAAYWRDLFDTIERKEKMTRPSVLAKADPYLEEDPFSMTEDKFREAREHRQSFYRKNDTLDAQMANFILEVFDKTLDLTSRIDEIPIAKPIDPSSN